MRKFIAEKGEIYHVFNRGTEKRRIFNNKKDYERFLINLVLFNTVHGSLTNISRYDLRAAYQKIPAKPLVKIHCFSLLPNHFHFMIEQTADNGIARFMHRVEMGYSRYFNIFYERNGHLFQGAYKMIPADRDEYLLYLPLYIHLNPLELLPSEKNWKEIGVKNKKRAFEFLKQYPWSSLQIYLGKKNFPFIARDVVDELYGNNKHWEEEIKNWLPAILEIFPV